MQTKADGTALVVTIQEHVIRKTFDKRFAIPLDFDFFRHSLYPYGFKERLIVRLELNSTEKLILCTGDTNATTSFQTFRSNVMQFLTDHMLK